MNETTHSPSDASGHALRILLISQYFYPEVGATQTRMFEFARNLSRLGHRVTVIGEFPNHPHGIMPTEYRGKWFEKDSVAGFEVLRVWVSASPVKNLRTRLFFYLSFMVAAILGSLKLPSRFDVVLATSPPLFVAVSGYVVSIIKRSRFVLDIRDLWPAAAVALGEISQPNIIRIAEKLEKFLYNKADRITAVTRGFCEHIRSIGIDGDKIDWVPNGTVAEVFDPNLIDSSIREGLGLQGKLVVTFAGTHGIAQGLDAVVETANLLRDRQDIVFFFIGEGPVKHHLMNLARSYGLGNIMFHPQVPLEEITPYLNMSDILLVPLRNEQVFDTFVPSKMFDFMACAKPVILSVPGEARAIMEESKGGIFVEPENPAALAEGIQRLGLDEELRRHYGENGRKFVLGRFTREKQAVQLHKILLSTEA